MVQIPQTFKLNFIHYSQSNYSLMLSPQYFPISDLVEFPAECNDDLGKQPSTRGRGTNNTIGTIQMAKESHLRMLLACS